MSSLLGVNGGGKLGQQPKTRVISRAALRAVGQYFQGGTTGTSRLYRRLVLHSQIVRHLREGRLSEITHEISARAGAAQRLPQAREQVGVGFWRGRRSSALLSGVFFKGCLVQQGVNFLA